MLTVKNVHKRYSRTGAFLGKKEQMILSGISFSIKKGECMGLVGESGSGKSTLSRLILGLETPCQGQILMAGLPVSKWKRSYPEQMSVVFQDYTTSVNPRFTVAQAVAEPLRAVKKTFVSGQNSNQDTFLGAAPDRPRELEKYILSLLDRVELPRSLMTRYPHELSGGQLQRVCIARAIVTRPEFILFDEALSSLDIPVQAQVLALLSTLKQDLGLTYLFIAHDLMTVTTLCDRVLFLHRGRIVEALQISELFKAKNGYAKQLLASAALFSGDCPP